MTSAKPLQRESSVVLPVTAPRHQTLARTLISEIEAGVYPVGSKLPREMDLCAQFGASRHTVRTALDSLVRLGLIKRTPRLGTFVKADRAVQGYHLKLGLISDLMQFSHETKMEVLSRELRTVSENSERALVPYDGQKWLFVRGLRHSEEHEVPISYHEVWVHPDYRAVTGVEGFITQPILELIEQQFVTSAMRVKQTIQSATAPESIQNLLQIRADTACLWVRREYYDDHDRLMELSLGVHPGDLFSYEMELER